MRRYFVLSAFCTLLLCSLTLQGAQSGDVSNMGLVEALRAFEEGQLAVADDKALANEDYDSASVVADTIKQLLIQQQEPEFTAEPEG